MLTIAKSVFIFLFIVLLSLPAVQATFAPFSFDAVQENKARPVFPEGNILEKLWSDQKYNRRVEEWFNATFPLRDIYIRTSNQVKYALFSESREVLVGKNGWITDKVVAQSLAPIDRLTDEQIDALHRRIEKFNNYLDNIRVELIIVPVPLKNELHRADLTFPSLVRPEKSGYERFMTRLLRDPALSVIDVPNILREVAKTEYLEFFKNDLHWTFPGAFSVGQNIVNTISKLEGGRFDWHDKPEFYLDENEMVGGDMKAMALLLPVKEHVWKVKDPSEFKCLIEPPTQPRPEHLLYTSNKETCSHSLIPTTVMVGNSFMTLFHAGYYDRFERLYRIHDLSYFSRLPELIPEGTKYLIWQFFELQITHQLSNPEWWVWLDTASPPVTMPQ